MRFVPRSVVLLSLLLTGCGNPYLTDGGALPGGWSGAWDSAPAEEPLRDRLPPLAEMKKLPIGKPFSKTLLLQGGGFNTAVHLGIHDALHERGYRPDLLISSCGGSVAAALIRGIPSRTRRLQMLLSPEFHEYLRSIRTTEQGGLFSALSLISSFSGHAGDGPDLFASFLLRTPGLGPLGSLDLSFEDRVRADPELRPSVLVVAGGVSGGSGPGARTFQEAYFTEPAIASRLQGRRSDIQRLFPDSRVERATLSVVPALRDAHRAYLASFADPFLFPPVRVGEADYVTGAINLHPLELALEISEEVAMIYPNRFDTLIEGRAFARAFGYDANERAAQVRSQEAGHWIDLTDSDQLIADSGLNPRLVAGSARIESGIPADLAEYRWKVQKQYRYGFERGLEGLHDSRSERKLRMRELAR